MKRKNGNGNMRISLIKKNGNMRMSLAHWHGEISVIVILYVNHHFLMVQKFLIAVQL